MKYKNNPFNIRATHSQWLGLDGSKNGFCTFYSIKYAVRVVIYLFLVSKTYKEGTLSVRACISKFCPFGDGNNNPDVYCRFLASNGVPVDHCVRMLSVAEWYNLLSAMASIETNYNLTYDVFMDGLELFNQYNK